MLTFVAVITVLVLPLPFSATTQIILEWQHNPGIEACGGLFYRQVIAFVL